MEKTLLKKRPGERIQQQPLLFMVKFSTGSAEEPTFGMVSRFGVNSITIAFTTFEGERERDKLRTWAMRELQGSDKALISSFLFTAQPKAPDSQRMWLTPCWYTPRMDDKPVAILAGD